MRRLVRCGLAALPATSCPPELSGGAFAARNTTKRDRLICDKRPQNSQEASVGRVMLPFCPRLRRLILHRACVLGVHIVDTRNCFYLHEVDPARWHTQIVGPRIPHPGCTMCSPNRWTLCRPTSWTPGGTLVFAPALMRPEPSDDCRQLAITRIMMGDTDGVTVLELAHRGQLINAVGFLFERPLPDGPDFHDCVHQRSGSLLNAQHFASPRPAILSARRPCRMYVPSAFNAYERVPERNHRFPWLPPAPTDNADVRDAAGSDPWSDTRFSSTASGGLELRPQLQTGRLAFPRRPDCLLRPSFLPVRWVHSSLLFVASSPSSVLSAATCPIPRRISLSFDSGACATRHPACRRGGLLALGLGNAPVLPLPPASRTGLWPQVV